MRIDRVNTHVGQYRGGGRRGRQQGMRQRDPPPWGRGQEEWERIECVHAEERPNVFESARAGCLPLIAVGAVGEGQSTGSSP